MLPYLLLILVLLCLILLAEVRHLSGIWWGVLPLVLIGFSAVRQNVGTDFQLYRWMFLSVDAVSYTNTLEKIPQEIGFVTVMYIVRKFTSDFQILLAVCSALTVLPVMVAIRKRSTIPALSLYLYVTLTYFPLSLNAIRQSIAVSFLFMAESYRKENRGLWLLFSILAMTFHSSSVIAFLTLVLVRRCSVRFTTYFTATLGVALFGTVIVQTDIVRQILDQLNERYVDYLDTASGAGFGTLLVLGVHCVIALFCIAMLRRVGIRYVPESLNTAYFILSLGVLIVATGNWVIGRFEPYFGIFGILAIPDAIRSSKNRNVGILLIGALSTVYMLIHISAYNGLVPYQSIWG